MAPARSARAALALQKLIELDPGFGSLALWMRHADADDGAPDPKAEAWTDGRSVFYGPRFATLGAREQVAVAAHQLMHVAFRHVPRGRRMRRRFGADFDPFIWTMAVDAIVNETLFLARFALPKPCVTLTELLIAGLGETLTPEGAVGAWDAEKLYLRLMRGREDDPRPARLRRWAETRAFRPDIDPEALARGADDDAAEDAEWTQRLAMARAGSGRGVLSRRLADLPEPRTPWESVLRTRLNRAVLEAPRPTMARPARRWIAMDAAARAASRDGPGYEPGMARRTARSLVAVGVDVSGSIPDPLLRRFAAEIAGIGRRTGAEVHVIVFDEDIRAERRMAGLHWESEITGLSFAEGGGTSFVAVVDRVAALRAAAAVILTDLLGPFGDPPGRIPVIWATPGEAPSPGCGPPFGQVLSLAR
jgi:predicted metal-dependent peptidase